MHACGPGDLDVVRLKFLVPVKENALLSLLREAGVPLRHAMLEELPELSSLLFQRVLLGHSLQELRGSSNGPACALIGAVPLQTTRGTVSGSTSSSRHHGRACRQRLTFVVGTWSSDFGAHSLQERAFHLRFRT